MTAHIYFSDDELKFLNHILMEERVENETCMFQESAALQAAEKSFCEVLGEEYPNQQAPRSDQGVESNFLEESRGTVYDPSDVESFYPDWFYDPGFNGYNGHDITVNDPHSTCWSSYSILSPNFDQGVESKFLEESRGSVYDPSDVESFYPDWFYDPSFNDITVDDPHSTCWSSYSASSSNATLADGPFSSPVSPLKTSDVFSEQESAMQFMKGAEEANRFLDFGSNLITSMKNGESREMAKEETPDVPRGKKNPHHETLEERSSKQSAVSSETTVSDDMFDMVLLCSGGKNESALRKELSEVFKSTPPEDHSQRVKGKRKKKGGGKGGRKGGGKSVVDLRTLLSLCAQAIAADDPQSANDFLKQIRQNATPTGDGMQRLAFYFADGLEARMAGSGDLTYARAPTLPTSAADVLRAYQILIATCPFRKISNVFANKTIMNVSEKATKLHIVDFGILYGFQWPSFMQRLSTRPGGPPKLRITGIDRPCPGFRPSARVEETGRRLSGYADTFGVPFEFNAITKKWETIELGDLMIEKDELLVVSCINRLRCLLDESVVVSSPRNIVLNLIREMNPAVFIQGAVNGSYSAPFFITRFREAMFHFSSLFDMFDTIIPREVHERMLLEKTVIGQGVVNVISCEGADRVDRPETYKQWQIRNTRAGLVQLPLDREIVKIAIKKVKSSYHKDFMIDVDGQWMLQGWKGRIIYALSSWRPAE